MKLTGDRILVEPIEEKSDVSDFFLKSPSQKGKIIEVGPGKKDDPMILCKGDTILYQKHAGTSLRIEGKELVIMRESDAFCAL